MAHISSDSQEQKFYAPGVGFVQAEDLLASGDIEQLVHIEFDGTAKDDEITGNVGADWLRGHRGNDFLLGGDGDDMLVGGRGRDVMGGEDGNDTFVFNDAKRSRVTTALRDVIMDFASGDMIDLREIDANTRAGGDQTFNFIGAAAAFGGTAGELRYRDSGTGGILLEGDRNGDRVADFQIELARHFQDKRG